MFVKVYVYHIQKNRIEDFVEIQEKASRIYRNYINAQTTYLQSMEDPTKWIEMTKYSSVEEYQKSLELINERNDIQELYHSFQTLLLEEKKEIVEENYMEVIIKGNV